MDIKILPEKNILSFQTFCPQGHFVSRTFCRQMFCPHEHFVSRTFCLRTVLSGHRVTTLPPQLNTKAILYSAATLHTVAVF
jgi:hypothetical protein